MRLSDWNEVRVKSNEVYEVIYFCGLKRLRSFTKNGKLLITYDTRWLVRTISLTAYCFTNN